MHGPLNVKISFNCKFVKLDQMLMLYNMCNYIYFKPFLLKLKINGYRH
jgi:hypothetical protein